jgi:hypothetical protein
VEENTLFQFLSAIAFHSFSNVKHSSEYFSPHSSLFLASSSGVGYAAENNLTGACLIDDLGSSSELTVLFTFENDVEHDY